MYLIKRTPEFDGTRSEQQHHYHHNRKFYGDRAALCATLAWNTSDEGAFHL